MQDKALERILCIDFNFMRKPIFGSEILCRDCKMALIFFPIPGSTRIKN